jgi:hypothetical protein
MQSFIGSRNDPYFNHTLSLLSHLATRHPDIYATVLPIISLQKSDIYLLVEPYKKYSSDGDYLIPLQVLKEWGASVPSILSPNTIDEDIKVARKYNIEEYIHAVQSIREHDFESVSASMLIGELKNRYKNLVDNNGIGNVRGIFPESLLRKYRDDRCRKLWEDDFRYNVFLLFFNLEREYVFDPMRFNEITIIIEHDMCCDYTSHEKCLRIVSKAGLIVEAESVKAINRFIYTPHFMYVPMTSAEVRNYPLKYDLVPSPDESKIWNTLVLSDRQRKVIEEASQLNRKSKLDQVVQLLKSEMDIPDDVKQELRSIISN